MNKIILEYVWLDGYRTANLRSKIKVLDWPSGNIDLSHVPEWNFDGSSTRQAPGGDSECLLKPVRIYATGERTHIVLCEVMNPDGSPHRSNQRAKLRDLLDKTEDQEFWWGFEQEYFITKDFKPLGFPDGGYPKPQGLYYCGVGGNQVVGRQLVHHHMIECLHLGMDITGVNAEVAVGQWEYQCFNRDTLKATDDLWISRYLLHKMAEVYGWDIDLSPKPVSGDWNGSGCHTNFSTKEMRTIGGRNYLENLMVSFEANHLSHIENYGENNDQRLTGNHETQRIDTFSWGVGDRGASVRIPRSMEKNNWMGYIEDRRPASNCDPYVVAALIITTTTEALSDD
jgi:glutamine synthetase